MSSPTCQQLTPSLWIRQSELYQTNSGIFLSDGAALLIDPGIAPHALRTIAQFVHTQDAEVSGIVLTHGHWDHILGPEQFPGVKIIAHAEYKKVIQTRKEKLQRQITNWIKKSGRSRSTPFILPLADKVFMESMELHIGSLFLQLHHAPGHAPDQLVVYHAKEGTLWAGDMLSELEIPLISHSLDAYEATLARLAQLEISTLIPGHGTPTQARAEIEARLQEDRDYLAELRARVTTALQRGASIQETVATGADMNYRHPEANATYHRWNVESVFTELGGECQSPVGWEQE